MKRQRIPSVPLITCDPYFSIWSPADALYEEDTCHWTGERKRITGKILIDGVPCRFMGRGEGERILPQTNLEITPTTSRYTFEGEGIRLRLSFLSPLLLTDYELVSRPVSYIEVEVEPVGETTPKVQILFDMGEEICYSGKGPKAMTGGVHKVKGYETAWMGKTEQPLLCGSGDHLSIDWGYLYAAVEKHGYGRTEYLTEDGESRLFVKFDFGVLKERTADYFAAAYDDIASVMYFGEVCKGYWARNGKTILDAIGEAMENHKVILGKCRLFDKRLCRMAEKTIGREYADICAAAYRQAVAAHKLVVDKDGEMLFLSKECDSNGCIGTVDISYPSAPLFLLFDSEYVKGMLRPVLKFARMPVWNFDFAPHDVGRYPHANGQVYGLKETDGYPEPSDGKAFPHYYLYPAGSRIYRYEMQMPVEECGNLLILCAAVSMEDGNNQFIEPHMDLMEKWAEYLMSYGEDPGEQLCTDDFAGHWAHNVNLAAKAVMGIEAYAILLKFSGKGEEASWYHQKARELAGKLEKRAWDGEHTVLAFGKKDTWSMKYNLVWDLIFDSHLFSKELFSKEIAWYLKQNREYGVPLDNRETYTKSDWILWVAAMTETKEEKQAFILPILKYLRETKTRYPFPDWYDTIRAEEIHFHNRTVQGGLFMPIYREMKRKEK